MNNLTEDNLIVGDIKLFCHCWESKNPNQIATVLLIHGFGDHGGASPYQLLAKKLTSAGYKVYSYDARGHGKSLGERGFINSWKEYREDLRSFFEHVKNREKTSPIFLIGISLGALVMLDYILHYPENIKGVVSVSTPIGKVGASPLMLAIGQLLSKILPRLVITPKLDLNNVSRDLETAKAYINDPLFHQRGTARFVSEFLKTADNIRSQASAVKLPFLMLHGGDDKIAVNDESFFENIASKDKEKKIYPKAYHNLFLEINKEEIFQDIETWLKQHS